MLGPTATQAVGRDFARWLLCLGLLVLAGCAEPKVQEVKRIPDTRGIKDIVIGEIQSDATVATPTEVYVVPTGHPVPDASAVVFRANKMKNFSVSWTSDGEVLIRADEAQIFFEKNVLDGGPLTSTTIKTEVTRRF